MRTAMGVLLMEDEAGGVAVQLFEASAAGLVSFGELRGRPGDPRRRATFVSLEWKDGKACAAECVSRDLPAAPEDAPDGWVLGEGPRRPEAGT